MESSPLAMVFIRIKKCYSYNYPEKNEGLSLPPIFTFHDHNILSNAEKSQEKYYINFTL